MFFSERIAAAGHDGWRGRNSQFGEAVYVAVDDTFTVNGVERGGGLDGDVQNPLQIHRTPVDEMLQSTAVEKTPWR